MRVYMCALSSGIVHDHARSAEAHLSRALRPCRVGVAVRAHPPRLTGGTLPLMLDAEDRSECGGFGDGCARLYSGDHLRRVDLPERFECPRQRWWAGSSLNVGSVDPPRASARHRVLAIDLLGFGQSAADAAVDFSLDDHVRALTRTLKHLHVRGPVVLVGHSM